MNLYTTRKLDNLGRIVLPKELRKKYQIEAGTAMDICDDTSGQIVLRKSNPYCKICGGTNCLSEVARKNIFVCSNCRSTIKEMDA